MPGIFDARRVVLSSLLLLLAGFALAEGSSELSYLVRPSDDLRSISVEVRFPLQVSSLRASDGETRRLTEVQGCDGALVRLRSGRIFTEGSGGCLRYHYPLEAQSGRRSPAVAPGVVVSAPDRWLWTPDTDDAIRIQLILPSGVRASVPWRPLGQDTYELAKSPGSSTAAVIFGAIDVMPLALDDARLRVAMVDGPDRTLERQKILDWLTASARDVAGVGGRFPNPHLQVIVQPIGSGSSRSAVPFGYVIRDGGETVRFFVDPERPLEDFLSDWTATHEFSHLLLPYVRSREKWVSEGFASYYQNVLLARRGTYSPTEAWSRLHRSFLRASEISNPPRLDRIDQRPFWEVRMLIYWSGAAMALQADTLLRERSNGSESLDTVLGRRGACCLPSGRVWRARELFEKLDRLADEPVFVELYEKLASKRGMPDLTTLFADLGLEPNGDRVRLTEHGRLIPVRRAIMGESPDR